MHHFAHDEAGRLCAEGVRLSKIAEEVGTPTFVYSRATIDRHFRVFDEAFAGHPHLVCYSVKANSNRAVLQHLGSLGSGADIVSGGELLRAKAAGIPPERIVFSGVGKTKDEMRAALSAGILAFNVESESELLALADVAAEEKLVAPVSLRVNPDIDAQTHPYIATGLAESKFGIPIQDARRLAEQIRNRDSLALVGVDCHIGSQLTSLDPLREALESVLGLVDELRADGHEHIEHIDLGGGLGIAYKSEAPPHPSELGRMVVERMRGRPERIILEPGRVIVGNAGLLLTRVLYVKQGPKRRFVIVDAAMNDLLRPSLYKAHHEIWPVMKGSEAPVEVDVVGPICETGDRFAENRLIHPVREGELLAVMSAGAYGFTMASNYNSRALAAEVMVHKDQYAVVRRRQSVQDIMAGEQVPAWNEGEAT